MKIDMNQITLFDDTPRLNMADSIRMTREALIEYGERFPKWQIAWSGGKDSTATLTLIIWMIESGMVPAPAHLRVLYADTRMELPPLSMSAMSVIEDLKDRGVESQVVTAPVHKRFLPYILGRGVPPPNNRTSRWCTRQIKLEPMKEAIDQNWLTITGVRIGESAARDERIVLSCSRDGSECGQGHYFQGLTNTLAPIVHWRVCHVWEWLKHWAPTAQYGDWDTSMLADAYGGEEAEEVNARTGCICCPLASKDRALDTILRNPKWAYLSPLKELRAIYVEMRNPIHRLRQPGTQRNKDGAIPENPNRMGPLTIESRKLFFAQILDVQNRINNNPGCQHPVDLLNQEEIQFIHDCWENKVFPNGWTGDEQLASDLYEEHYKDGSIQKMLFQIGDL
jgi:DNA sulfur modification protein DndC